MAATFDYTSLLPGDLESTLQTLTKVYRANSDQLSNAYLYTVLPGVNTSSPDIVSAKDIEFQVAFRSFPSLRNLIAYANLIVSLIPAITDRDTLVSILLPEASGWQQLDVSDLGALNKEYKDIFESYLPILDPILKNLQQFQDELVNVGQSEPPAWFNQTLFDTLRPILSFANFQDGVLGESSLAGILGLPITTVNTPLSKVLFPLLPTTPAPKDVISQAIQEHLVDAIQAYSGIISSLIPLFSTFAEAYDALAKEQAAIVPRIEANAAGDPPATADECIAAWNGVSAAATAFINLLSGGGSAPASASAGTGSAAEDPTQSAGGDTKASVSPGDVTAAFGPPSEATTTLPEMSATTGQIVENFNKILSLPFIDDLKVTDLDGVETSVYTVMVNCKRKYEALQGRTVEIVKLLNAYSLLQDVVLPLVNTDGGLTLEEFLLTNLPLVQQYGQDAKQIAADTQDLLDEFEKWLAVLDKNLDEINKSIESNKSALDAAQSAYDSATAGAIISGILAAVFTAIAIAALAFGQGALAIGMGMSAGASFAEMINEAVQAGKLSVVIGNLKNVIATSEVTRDQLKVVIPLFRNIITLMGSIHTIWERISTTLTDVKDTYNLWNNPAYFTPDSIKGALQKWREVHEQCEKYISIVAGQPSSFRRVYWITKETEGPFIPAKEPPPPYSVTSLPAYRQLLEQPLTTEDRVGKFRALAKANDINNLIAALLPPSFTSLGSSRSQLTNAASSYRSISSLLNGIYNDSASDATRLANTITDNLIPSLSKAIDFYITFANGQEDPFAKGTSQDALTSMIAERFAQLKQGSDLTKAAETIFINFQNDSQGAINLLTRHINELNQQIASKEAALRDLQAQYDEWSWVLWWPFPPGIGAIIYLIIDAITETTSELSKLRNDINKLNSTQAYVSSIQSISVDVSRTTSALSQGWSDLTTKTNNLQTIVGALVISPTIVEAVRPAIQAQWKVFSDVLKQW